MCIVSRYPFFDAFRRFLTFLYSTLEDGSFDYQHVEPYIVQLVGFHAWSHCLDIHAHLAHSGPNPFTDRFSSDSQVR